MITISPYLNFPGNTEEAFNFYKTVFNGEFLGLQRFGEIPSENPLSESDAQKIMHASLSLGNGVVLMATDVLESMGQKLQIGDNISLSINTESKEEAHRIFHALSESGNIDMPIADTFWGAYFGMFTDKFGVRWMVNYDYPSAEG